jgi:hypothetical protein
MAAAKYDITIEQGATFIKNFVYQDSNGNPINMTGMTLTAQVKRTYSDTTPSATFTCTIANQAISANLGNFTIELSSIETAALLPVQAQDFQTPSTNYCWDLYLNTGTIVKRLLMGTAFLSPEVTV